MHVCVVCYGIGERITHLLFKMLWMVLGQAKTIMVEIAKNAQELSMASDSMGEATEYAKDSMIQVKNVVDSMTRSSTKQAENSLDTVAICILWEIILQGLQ